MAEIDALIKKILSKKVKNANKGLHLPLYLGILAAGVGMLLGVILSPIFLILSELGLAGVAYDLIYSRKNGSSDDGEGAMARACELIRSYGYTGELGDDVIERLYEIKARAEADKRAQGDRALTLEKIKALTSEIGEDERALREFIMLFPVAATSSIREAITEILKKRVLYSAIKEARMTSNKKREERLLLASKYDAEVSAFLSRFPTATQRPFDEINARLIEYNAQKLSIERMSASLAAFAEEHGINPENICESDEPTLTESLESEALDEKISELERQRALSERALRNYADELERIDELQEKKEALLEKEEEYERRLGIILKTEDYLSRAKDNLTSKYLSKTKCAFDKYISLISREVGEEFSMDTSFALMKNESGTLRVAEAYSKGTRDLYALATRFALIDSLYSDEAPFVILDDPFAYFDDAKFSRAVSVIKNLAKGRQIIYLTCSDARKI